MAVNAPLTPSLKVGGSPLAAPDQKGLIQVVIELQMNLPSRCIFRYGARDIGDVGHATAPGTPVEVAVGPTVVFTGEIVAAEVERTSEAKPTVTLVAYDKANRLSFSAHTKTWQNASMSAVLGDLASACDLSLEAQDLPTTAMQYLLQAGTDLELLDVLTRRAGTEWWALGGKLVVRKTGADGPLAMSVPAKDLHRFAVRSSANRPDSVVVRGWDSVQQTAISTTTQRSAAKAPASGGLVDQFYGASWVTRTHHVSSVPVESSDEATVVGTAIVGRAAAGAVHAEGEGTGLEKLEIGKLIEIKDGGSLTGKYVVTRLEHRWAPGQAITTRFSSGDRRPVGLASEAEDERAAIDSYSGIVVGEVTNINDPDKRGRVRVRFVGLDTQEESNWARVLIPGGGAERGSVALPEVKDEVLVGFEAGDLRRPVVLGGLFGSTNKIPLWQVEGGKVAARRTTSRLGHYFEYGDGTQAPAEHLLLSFKDGKTKFRLGKDKVELLSPDNIPVTITAGSQSSISFDGKGGIVIKGKTIELNALQDIKIGGQKIEGDAKLTLKLSGSSTEIAGKASTKVSGSGSLQLQGGIVKIN